MKARSLFLIFATVVCARASAADFPLHDPKTYPPGTITDAGPVTYVDGYNIAKLGDEVMKLRAEVTRLQAGMLISKTTPHN